MRFSVVVIVCFVVMLACGCGSRVDQKKVSQAVVPQVDKRAQPAMITREVAQKDEHRKQIALAYSEAFRRIASKSRVPKARDVYNFLLDHEVFATLRGDKYQLFGANRPDRVAVLTVMPTDPPDLVATLDEETGASYWHETRDIYLRSELASEFVLMLCYGHEWYHAYDHAAHSYSWPEGYLETGEGELPAYEFQIALQMEYGGPKYRQWVETRAEAIKKQIDSSAGRKVEIKAGKYDPNLDSILGPSVSHFDRFARQTQSFRAALWMMLDRYYPAEFARKKKLQMILGY